MTKQSVLKLEAQHLRKVAALGLKRKGLDDDVDPGGGIAQPRVLIVVARQRRHPRGAQRSSTGARKVLGEDRRHLGGGEVGFHRCKLKGERCSCKLCQCPRTPSPHSLLHSHLCIGHTKSPVDEVASELSTFLRPLSGWVDRGLPVHRARLKVVTVTRRETKENDPIATSTTLQLPLPGAGHNPPQPVKLSP